MIKKQLFLKKCFSGLAVYSLSFLMLSGCGVRSEGPQGQNTAADSSAPGTAAEGSQSRNAASKSSASETGTDGSQSRNAASESSASGTKEANGRDVWETYQSWDQERENPGEGSSFIYGYIKGFGDRTLMIDQIEWITDDDKDRVAELIDAGVIGEGDLMDGKLYPAGYFIYNEDEEPTELAVDEEAEFIFLDAFDLFDTGDGDMYLTGDFEEFSDFVNAFLSVPDKPYGPPHGPAGGPFVFEIKDGAVRKVYERIIAG